MGSLANWSVGLLFLLGCANALLLGLYSKEQKKTALLANLRSFLQLGALALVLVPLARWEGPMVLLGSYLFIVFFASYTLYKRVNSGLLNLKECLAAISLSTLPNVALAFLLVEGGSFAKALFFIPFVGMLVGNALNGLTLGFDSFFKLIGERRNEIVQAYGVGAAHKEALAPYLSRSLRAGLTPIINGMLVVGIVSVPGLMTGQLMAGQKVLAAAKYQYFLLVAIQTTVLYGLLVMGLLIPAKLRKRPSLWEDGLKEAGFKVPALDIKPGEITKLEGPSGSGKTSIYLSLLGLKGEKCRRLDPSKGEAVYLSQYHPAGDRKAQDFVDGIFSYKANRGKAFSGSLLRELNKHDILAKPMDALSGGEKQLLMLSVASELDPPALLLDEACASMDKDLEERVWKHLESWLKKRGVIYTTHAPSALDRFKTASVKL